MGVPARIELNFTHADHALRFDIPNFESQATKNCDGAKGSGFGLLQFRDLPQHFWQAIKRDSGVQMMDVMIANVGSEPGHYRVCLEEAGRFQSGFFIGPAGLVAKGNVGKVMLSVKEVSADGVSDEVRDGLGEEQSLPAEEQSDGNTDGDVNEQGDQAIKVFAGIVEERINAHPINEHEEVAEEDGEGMAHELVFKAFCSGRS